MLCCASKLGSFAGLLEANMEFARKKAWNLDFFKIHRDLFSHVKIYRPPKTTQKRKLSHLGQIANMKIENLSWTAAHLSARSQNELASGEKDTIRRSKELTVITTASGKAESTEAPTACVNIHQQCYLWVYYSKEKATPMNGKGRVSISDYRFKSDKVQD